MTVPREVDLVSSETYAHGHPHELYAYLREHDPVCRQVLPDGREYWAVMRYDDIRFVNVRHDLFSHAPTSQLEDDGSYLAAPSMVMIDPPEHVAVRKASVLEFLPTAVRARMAGLRQLAAEIVDDISEAGTCDLVVDVGGRMASYVTADVLEIPRADAVDLYHEVEIALAGGGTYGPERVSEAIATMGEYGMRVLAERRDRPGTDVLSRLAVNEIDGRRLTDEEWLSNFMLLVVGAGDTTRHLISGGMLALFEHPDQRRLLATDPDRLLPSAVEEMLRWVTPVVYNRRTAKADCELSGVTVREGDTLAVYYGSGNRDPAAFAAPDRFDVTRSPNAHLAFSGAGPHFCLGAHLARAEAVAVIAEVLTRLPDIEQSAPVEFDASNFVSGPARLMASFTPRARRG